MNTMPLSRVAQTKNSKNVTGCARRTFDFPNSAFILGGTGELFDKLNVKSVAHSPRHRTIKKACVVGREGVGDGTGKDGAGDRGEVSW